MSLVEAAKPKLPSAQVAADAVKKWAAAHPSLAKLLDAEVPPAEALARWGLGLMKANHAADAAEIFRAALALAPSDPVLWTNLGMALNQAGSTAQALACLQYSVDLLHIQPVTWLMLGIARKKNGDFTNAESAFRIALEQNPKSAAAWQLLGMLKEEQKEFVEAAKCLVESLKITGPNPAVLANVGKLHHQTGNFPESRDAYSAAAELEPSNAHFRQMARRTRFICDAMNGENIDLAIAHYRDSFADDEAPSEADMMNVFRLTFELLGGFGHTDAALRLGKKWGELWPTSASLNYLMSAVAGDQTIDRSPPEYVVEYFDSFAEGFDAQLVNALGYDVPQKICAAVNSVIPSGASYDTLDAGCGTGLCGPLLRPICKSLMGVDLSQKMLDQAARKNVYDALACEEVVSFLRHSTAKFEIIVAADLMIYFGDLTALFVEAAAALHPAGLFAFSTELWQGEGQHRLLPSGRFAHAPQAIRDIFAMMFEEILCTETTIRLDGTRRLPGNIFILRRRATNS